MNLNDKIALTGATGMVGGELALALARKGYADLVLLVRDAAKVDALKERFRAEGLDPEVLHPVVAQLENYTQVRDVLAGVAVVFHCAAAVSFGDDSGNIVANNVDITSSMVDASIACGVGKFVYVSSIAALGGVREGGLITEKTEFESIEGQSPYSVSKFLAEKEVQRGALSGLRSVIVNPSVILGEGPWQGAGSSALVAVVASGLPVYTEGITGYVDSRDVARALMALAECDEAVGESFILSAASLTYRELITKAAEAASKRPPRIKVGRAFLATLVGAEKFLSVFGYKPRFSRFMARSMVTRSIYDGTKITRFTDFEYTPIDQTLTRVVTAFVNSKR